MTDKQTPLQRAKRKYHAKKTKQVLLRFLVDQDADIINWLNSLEKGETMKYARAAFRAEMVRQEKSKGES